MKLFVAAATCLLAASAQASRVLRVEADWSTCIVENGFDFVGEDIKNGPGQYADCIVACDKTPECHAYTWTNYNGGTCWLKRTRGKVVFNAGAISTACYKDAQQPACQATPNVDYVGNDIGNAPAKQVSDCCGLCINKLGCRAYSWTNQNGGTCYLKSGRGATITKEGVWSGDIFPNDLPLCTQEVGIDYEGHDLTNKPSASANGCCGICQGIPACVAWSWSNYNGGTCWLKDFKGNAVKKAGVISAKVRENPPQICQFEENTDYVGYDLGNAPSKDAGACCTLCKGIRACVAVSWSNYNGGTCWFKTNVGDKITKAGVKSSRVW